VFLYTGSRRGGRLLAALYVLVAAAFFHATFVERPPLEVRPWLVGFEDSSLLYRSVYALVGLPPIVASLAYLSLLRHTQDPAQRRRVLLTSLGILAYVGGGLAARLADDDLVVFLTLVPLGLLSAAATLMAHTPPRPRATPRPAAARAQDDAFAQRLRELV
ncbi:MAG TPA: hypothetical protein VHI93_05995, partial [Candidatus Thermoplasmatota archaeon]|nr:hypothetical protein [Candidatus Thermoplasmatota archaeon]